MALDETNVSVQSGSSAKAYPIDSLSQADQDYFTTLNGYVNELNGGEKSFASDSAGLDNAQLEKKLESEEKALKKERSKLSSQMSSIKKKMSSTSCSIQKSNCKKQLARLDDQYDVVDEKYDDVKGQLEKL